MNIGKPSCWLVKLGITIGICLVCWIMGEWIFIHAETSQEIAQEKQKIDEKKESVQKELEEKKKVLHSKEKAFEQTKKEIHTVVEELKAAQKRVEVRKNILDNRLRVMQKQGGLNPYIQAILESESLSHLFHRFLAIKTIVHADQDLIEEQLKDMDILVEKKEELTQKKQELEKQFQALQKEYDELENEQAELNFLSSQLGTRLEQAKQREQAAKWRQLQQQTFENLSLRHLSSKAPTQKGKIAIEEASQYIGYPYVWGGSTPYTSFDCSGFTQWAFKKAGIHLPRTAAQQYLATHQVSVSEAQVGDLVFFSYGDGISHVGIYIGNGQMLNAQNHGVRIDTITRGYWQQYLVGFGRVPGI